MKSGLRCAAGLLCAAGLAQAAGPRFQDIETEQEKWIEEIRMRLSPSEPVPFSKFDELFDDEFFRRKYDPFAEIDSFPRRMGPFLSEEQRSLFARSLDDWLKERMEVSSIQSAVKITEREVVASFRIRGLKRGSLRVGVTSHRIRISYNLQEAQHRFEKLIPVPAGADAGVYRILREGNSFKIVFAKRPIQP